jgi:hypothetical protein
MAGKAVKQGRAILQQPVEDKRLEKLIADGYTTLALSKARRLPCVWRSPR